MSIALQLNCLFYGDDPLSSFPVRIAGTDTVSTLKDVIKGQNPATFRDFGIPSFGLWKVRKLYRHSYRKYNTLEGQRRSERRQRELSCCPRARESECAGVATMGSGQDLLAVPTAQQHALHYHSARPPIQLVLFNHTGSICYLTITSNQHLVSTSGTHQVRICFNLERR